MSRLIEMWGDTVDSRHVGGAVAIGVGVAVPAYLVAAEVFTSFVDEEALGRSYALLTGLAGCLVAAVVCARLFKPKRVLVEAEGSQEARAAAFETIRREVGDIGDPALLSPAVQRELHQLNLYDALVAEHATDVARAEADAEADHTADTKKVQA